eukprot:m.4336 g.4336  ORF g.4336 m.4336 type:complete len:351 (+) comp2960_c0_seq2:137-1189(+)
MDNNSSIAEEPLVEVKMSGRLDTASKQTLVVAVQLVLKKINFEDKLRARADKRMDSATVVHFFQHFCKDVSANKYKTRSPTGDGYNTTESTFQDEESHVDLNKTDSIANQSTTKQELEQEYKSDVILGLERIETKTTKEMDGARGMCFNCGSKQHVFTSCPEPLNKIEIAKRKKIHFKNLREEGTTRELAKHRFSDIAPCQLSSTLREALGISSEQEPPWVFRMKHLGLSFPLPGWKGREFTRPKFEIFDDEQAQVSRKRPRSPASDDLEMVTDSEDGDQPPMPPEPVQPPPPKQSRLCEPNKAKSKILEYFGKREERKARAEERAKESKWTDFSFHSSQPLSFPLSDAQ